MNKECRKLTLDEIKQIELDILKHFKAYCEENQISFFLSNGTLLGAVKYGGFIPWDDDIDVFVPREDYNKLIRQYSDSKKYKLFSHEREENFYFPFAKLCDMTTLKVEHGVDNGIELGLDIDIFPLDYWGQEIRQSKEKLKKMKNNLLQLNLSKTESGRGRNLLRTIVKWFVVRYCKSKGASYYVRKMIDEGKLAESYDHGYMGCVVWPIYGESEIIPSNVFQNTEEMQFEDTLFPVPTGYDTYLQSLYGDYIQDPPIEKQVTHHRFQAYL